MRESALQKKCLDWVKKEYEGAVLAVNIHGGGYSNKGFPDLIVFGNQKAIVVELKADSGYKLQPDQIIWRNRFVVAGINHYVTKKFDEFKDIVRKEFQ